MLLVFGIRTPQAQGAEPQHCEQGCPQKAGKVFGKLCPRDFNETGTPMSASFSKVCWHHVGVPVCSLGSAQVSRTCISSPGVISTSLVCRSHRTWEQDIAQTNSPDRSRTAFARRFVKHLFKGEPDARCHTVATVLLCKAQPNTPGVG